MNDMTAVIVPKSDQINADDLIGGPITITIREVHIKGGQEQPVSIYFHGSDKAFRPCKSMSRVMVAAWGADASAYKGRSLTLFRDPTVKWGGMDVGGIRISHMTDIEDPMTLALTATKGSRKPFVVRPLVAEQQVDRAAEWTDGFIDQLGTCDVRDLKSKHAKTLTKLQTERPELYAKVETALAALDAAFEEGPADEQRGETNAIDADFIIEHINKKVKTSDVNALVESHMEAIMSFPDEDKDRIVAAQLARVEQIKADA